MKGDRDLVSIERSLGLRSVRGISRQSNKDSPPIKAILDGIRAIANTYVAKSNGEIRASHALRQDARDLLHQHGPDIWPGPEHERPPWLEEPSEDAFEGKYPRHLYFTNPTDRQILGERFYSLVVEKCCNYHDNQLQKQRRVSAKKQLSHDDSPSVTPRREDLPWMVDGGLVDGGDSDDVEMGGADPPPPLPPPPPPLPPTNSWSAVNMQPTPVIVPPPTLPSPVETPQIMPHGLPGVFEPKREPSPAPSVQNDARDVEMSSLPEAGIESRSKPSRDFDRSFLGYYVEDSDGDGDDDGPFRRKRKRDLTEEYETASKRGRGGDEEETTNGHHDLLVKFKVNSAQLSSITSKDPRPGTFPGPFQYRHHSPAQTTTSSIADSSAYQGELGRTRGRSRLDSLKTETTIHVTQYRDKRGKWYEVDIDSRPDWATDERVITRTVPRGRPPSNYVNRREGSSRASSVADSITHTSELRASVAAANAREESELKAPAQDGPSETTQDEAPETKAQEALLSAMREEAVPKATQEALIPSRQDDSPHHPRDAESQFAKGILQQSVFEHPTVEQPGNKQLEMGNEDQGELRAKTARPSSPQSEGQQSEDGIARAKSREGTPHDRFESRRSSVPDSFPQPDQHSMPPPSHIPSQSPSSRASPERLRVVPLTALPPGPPMLTPRPAQGLHDKGRPYHSPFQSHAHQQPQLQPQPPPGFRLHPHTPSHHHEQPPAPPQQQPQQQQPQQIHRKEVHEPAPPLPRAIYAHPGPGPPPRAEPHQARYPSGEPGPQRKHSLPLGVPLQIRPDNSKEQPKASEPQARDSAASEPPAVTAAPGDQPPAPRWASVNVRDQAQHQFAFNSRREDKEPIPSTNSMRSPGIGNGDVLQLPTRRPQREAPYAQAPQHAAAASNMQMTWNPTADNILGEFIHSPVGRHLRSQETPRNLLAVFKEIMIEEPAARTDFQIFNLLAERRRQDQRYVREAIRKHVDPSHAVDMPLPLPPQAPNKVVGEQRVVPQAPRPAEANHVRYGVPPHGQPTASSVPGSWPEVVLPRDAVAGAESQRNSPYQRHMHIEHGSPPVVLPRPPILPSQLPKPEAPDEKSSSMPSGGISLEHVTVEINWGRNLDFSDYMPMQDCSTAREFFELVETQLPHELRGQGKKIKEIRVKALTELAGGGRLPRIVRDEGPGRIALRQLVKKLRSQPPGSEPELEFLVVWEDVLVNN